MFLFSQKGIQGWYNSRVDAEESQEDEQPEQKETIG